MTSEPARTTDGEASGRAVETALPARAGRFTGLRLPEDFAKPSWSTLIWVMLGCVLVACAIWTVDGAIAEGAARLWSAMPGDVKRATETLQQFGQGESLILIAVIVWCADPARRGRVLDLGAAGLVTWLVTTGLKMGVGRPRPKFGDPGVLLGPTGAYPMPGVDPPGVYHAWDLSAPISAELWSMPSSHTSMAVVTAVYLWRVYPRLRAVAVGMAIFVGLARVLTGAHYLSDVVVGAGVGFVCAEAALGHWWGVRGLDALWRLVVNPKAETRFERLYRLGPPVR